MDVLIAILLIMIGTSAPILLIGISTAVAEAILDLISDRRSRTGQQMTRAPIAGQRKDGATGPDAVASAS